jgi:hypothetical protein
VKALAGALKCAPEDLATWVARRRGHDADDEVQSLVALPPSSTLARRARREKELGRDAETLDADGVHLALLGPTLLKRCHAACATVEGMRFGAAGLIKDYEALPPRAAAVLGVPVGSGARFLLARNVARGVPFYVTVFTRELAHTRQLIDLAESQARIQLVVRVVLKPAENDWKGFFIFEKRPRPHPFAFIVEALYDSE